MRVLFRSGVDRIKAAIMLVHGAKDERVPIKHMHELVDRMAAVGKKPEQIVVEKKEAHGFRDIDNNVNLYTKMLAFFDRHIGGKQATAQTPCKIGSASRREKGGTNGVITGGA